MIRIEDVSFRYANSKDDALEHINLHIHQGEFVVLLGSSGCGKTTITRLINRLVPEFFEGELEGKVYIDGQDTSDLDISVPADSSEPEGEISSSVGDVSERDLPESVKLSPKNPSVSADSIEKEQENE